MTLVTVPTASIAIEASSSVAKSQIGVPRSGPLTQKVPSAGVGEGTGVTSAAGTDPSASMASCACLRVPKHGPSLSPSPVRQTDCVNDRIVTAARAVSAAASSGRHS